MWHKKNIILLSNKSTWNMTLARDYRWGNLVEIISLIIMLFIYMWYYLMWKYALSYEHSYSFIIIIVIYYHLNVWSHDFFDCVIYTVVIKPLKMGIQSMEALSEKAEFMRESLEKSQTITDNMVTILGSFDHRLSALETAMRPTQVFIWNNIYVWTKESSCFARI